MAIESNTIGELINECYAFPYSKLYYEMCKAAAEESLRAQYLESYEFWNCIEGTPLDESGPSSDPDFYIGSDESMYESAASIYDYDEVMYESSDDDRKGPGVLRKGANFIKKIFKKFINGMKKILFGIKADEEKIKKHISNITIAEAIEHEYTEQEVDDIIYALTSGKGADGTALDIWVPRTRMPGITIKGVFEFSKNQRPHYKRGTGLSGAAEKARHGLPMTASRVRDAAFENFINFLFSWKENKEFRFYAHTAFENYSMKYGAGYAKGNNKKITDINVISDNFNVLFNRGDDISTIPKNLKTSQDALFKNGIIISLASDKLDEQIKTLTDLQEGIGNIDYAKMGSDPAERLANTHGANTHTDKRYTDTSSARTVGTTTVGQANYIKDYTSSHSSLVETVGATLYAYTWLKQRLDELVAGATKLTGIVNKSLTAEKVEPEKKKI